jgi:protein-tyrosine phosphatase
MTTPDSPQPDSPQPDNPQSETPALTHSALFICTGNFHRSRFAEHLFNAIAQERGLPWTAISRGTNVEGSRTFFKGRLMSPEAQQALDDLSIEFRADLRDPLQLTPDDLAIADVIIAVCEDEHRPHIERDFLAAAERVQYWGVFDVPIWPAGEGLAKLDQLVRDLIDHLASQPTYPEHRQA